ncbi:carbohydrate ABC transporter permease [Caldilinea sp.]|uniref:carbohydrate ABC transporter permease n=1 Tax=Caldilinea sp. TaxID=2293560 RepID=UPI0021DC63C2|nr:carbohydrate ABC transporter permease [Caldilinea sp.]GIV68645.1 MAG: sugar ABC transporter permease [Caldilinea sp.]
MFRKHRTVSLAPNYIILTILALFSVSPIVLLVLNSLKYTNEIQQNPFGLPETPRFGNYIDAWVKGGFTTTMINTLILTGGTILLVVVVGGLAAFALARFRFKGANALSFYLLVGTSMPALLFMVPLYFMWARLGLVNNLFGLIIIYAALFSPFATYLLRSFLVSIPMDYEEAARIDGANDLQVFLRVILPLAWPGFLTVVLVVGLAVWNEFLFAVTFLQRPELKPISTSLLAFQTRFQRDWGLTSAASVIMIVPIIILFLSLQRQFIEGLARGGLKG